MHRDAKNSEKPVQGNKVVPKKNQPLDLKKNVPPLPFEKHSKAGKKENPASNKVSQVSIIESVKKMNKENDELKEMVEKGKAMSKEIDQMIKEIQTKTGLTFEAMRAYIGNPANFSEQEWKSIQKRQQEAEKSLLKGGRGVSAGAQNAAENSVNDQKRRSKAIGARRKWLPMS